MKNTIGYILNNPDLSLGELTSVRSAITLPFGGRYRLVDFALSNLVNAGIRKIGVFASGNYRSLVDHLGIGSDWSLSRKSQDLNILQGGEPSYLGNTHYMINLEDFQRNLGFLTHTRAENVIISASNLVCNLDFEEVLAFHSERNADVTIVTQRRLPNMENIPGELGLSVAEDGRVVSMSHSQAASMSHRSLEMMVIRSEVLERCIKQATAGRNYDLMGILRKHLSEIRVYSCEFSGYIRVIHSLDSYWRASMDLLNPSVLQHLFRDDRAIFTKIKDNSPTRYGVDAQAVNSVIAAGCNVEGSVNSSIVFRDVDIGEGSVVSGSILMENCTIGRGVILENVILDRAVTIADNVVLQGTPGNPVVMAKGMSL